LNAILPITMPALEELERCDILDTPPEEAFDRITRIVCRALTVPISTVTFLDGHRQWFKSRQGVGVAETPRNLSFCRVPIAEGRLVVVADTLDDARFRENPFVVTDPRIRFYAGAPLRSPGGVCIGTLCAMDTAPRTLNGEQISLLIDLARIVEDELALRILATTDSLTGVVARRAFMEEGERAVSLALRHRYDLSCVSFDLDHFKAINDAYGHAAGDAVLAATARTCTTLLRKSDIFGRLGGEEFSVLLPHTTGADAAIIAEKLRVGIQSQATTSDIQIRPATASFGVAGLTSSSTDLASLLETADTAMYDAKSLGRNCCIVGVSHSSDTEKLGRRVLKAGSIAFNGGNSVLDCTVRRLSEMGASLDVVSSDAIPKRFKLSIESDGFSKLCEIVRKDARQIEIVFA
jgi:diguanylate cyclase (GGDEF)-like protein